MGDIKEKLLNLILDTGALSTEQISTFQSNQGKFENAFVINMKNRKERLEEATKALGKVNITFERFIAIDGKNLCDKDKHFWSKIFPKLRPGELGCLLSHLAILALAATHPNDCNYTMIFEDDIITSLTASIDPTLRKLIQLDQHGGIDLIYLGKCMETCSKMHHIEDNIYFAHSPSCAHAYAIKNSFACRLLDILDKSCLGHGKTGHSHPDAAHTGAFNCGIDGIYKWFVENKKNSEIKTVVIHPAIFYQDVLRSKSDLRDESLSNYLECIDSCPLKKHQKKNDEREPEHVKHNDHAGGIIILAILLFFIVIFVAAILMAHKRNQKMERRATYM